MLEIGEDRYGRGATLVTSQIPWTDGTTSLATPLWPTGSWTASLTTPIASNYAVNHCAKKKAQENAMA